MLVRQTHPESTRVVLVFAACLCLSVLASALNFSPIDTLSPDAATDSFVADEAADVGVGNFVWVAVWQATSVNSQGEIYFSRSTNGGAAWSAQEKIKSDASPDSSQDINPRIATDGLGNWVCVWESTDSLDNTIGTDADILASYSTDNGQHWSEPVVVNSSADADGSALDQKPAVAADGAGNWIVVWHSDVSAGGSDTSDIDIFYAISSDDGVSWSDQAVLNLNALTDTGTDINPSISTDGAGTWVCAWHSTGVFDAGDEGDADILFSRSVNNGGSWSAVDFLNTTGGTDYAGQEFNVRLANDAAGNWVAVWDGYDFPEEGGGDDYDIYRAYSSDDGVNWSAPDKIVSDAGLGPSDGVPCIATDANGRWLAAWRRQHNDGTNTNMDIFYSESVNNGVDWTTRKAVQSNANSDTNDDLAPAVAASAAGKWVVVWNSFENIDGDGMADHDIMFARNVAGPAGTLTLTLPNGGERWKIGKRGRIEWNSTGSPGANVKLELYRNGAFVQTIKGSTANDGSQRWKVPATVATGGGYKVRIQSTSSPSISDLSDGTFRIKPAK